ncbi:MAG: MIP/aquaporin family protein [Candidatus Limnocylindrales bacterium]
MDRTLRPALLAEAVGTFIFFTVGAGAVVITTYTAGSAGLLGVALAHGIALAVLVSAFGAVSGGHFNPAVTVAVWVAGKISAGRAAWYIVAQAAGALGAALLLRGIFSEAVWQPTHLGTPTLGPDVSQAMGIVIELVATLLLVFAVLGTAVDPRGPRIGGLAIGLAITADILFAGPLTGAAMNPARWFGPAIVSGFTNDWYVWIVGPFGAAIIAGLLWRYVFAERT